MFATARAPRDGEHSLDRWVVEALEQDAFPHHSGGTGQDDLHASNYRATHERPQAPKGAPAGAPPFASSRAAGGIPDRSVWRWRELSTGQRQIVVCAESVEPCRKV